MTKSTRYTQLKCALIIQILKSHTITILDLHELVKSEYSEFEQVDYAMAVNALIAQNIIKINYVGFSGTLLQVNSDVKLVSDYIIENYNSEFLSLTLLNLCNNK